MNKRERNLRAALAKLEKDVQQYACPIYGVKDNIGQLIGSGFLFDVANATILLTAAHVLHERHSCELQIPGQTRAVPFGGQAYSTGPARATSAPDYEHDIAFMLLDMGSLEERLSVPFLTPDQLDVNDVEAKQTAYGFVGFPVSENKSLPGFKFMRASYYYGGQPAEEQHYAALGFNKLTHFIMTFDHEQMVDESGNVVKAAEPPGMSGGPVWKLGTFREIDSGTASPRVIALTIEWWRGRKVLVGVRLALLTEALRQIVPSLAESVPQSAKLRTNVTVNEI